MPTDDQARQDDPLSRYRPCVGIMVINRDGLVWMGLRSEALDQIEGRAVQSDYEKHEIPRRGSWLQGSCRQHGTQTRFQLGYLVRIR